MAVLAIHVIKIDTKGNHATRALQRLKNQRIISNKVAQVKVYGNMRERKNGCDKWRGWIKI